MLKFAFVFVLLLLNLFAAPAFSQTEIKAEHSGLRIFALQTQVREGESLDVAFDFTLEPEWHIYWRNPGDSGAAPRVDLQGAKLLKWNWPAPERITIPPLTNYGYESRVVFPVQIQPDPGVREIVMKFEWLVCKVECVPVFATMKLPVKWGSERLEKSEDHPERILWTQFLERVPLTDWTPEVRVSRVTDSTLGLRFSGKDLKVTEEIWVFPHAPSIFKTEAPQVILVDDDFEVTLPFATNRDLSVNETDLTVVLKGSLGQKAFEYKASLQEAAPPVFKVLLFAFLGGLILNLMPCVFPVLALKVFGILREPDRRSVRKSGWLYTAGVLFSFLILGAALLALRAGGEALGWGFQLQSPAFVLMMLVLFFLMGLNFAGVFEIGTGLMNTAGRLSNHGSMTGSFGTGVLAVFVASPCTAPFMGSALGATLLLPVPLALLVFLFLGLGLAFPILMIGEIPNLGKKLPRPGAWMETFKQFMAFPMFATSAWLLWVLQFQTGPDMVLKVLLTLIVLSMAIWLAGLSKKITVRVLAVFIFVAASVWVARGIQLEKQQKSASDANVSTDSWQSFSKEKIEQARGKNPVFVDFTASWCITCQVNKLNVLNTPSTLSLFRDNKVLLLKADWTDRDPLITEALRTFGRNSVPLYVYYSAEGDVKVLPEILTSDMILQLFEIRRTQ